MINVIFACDENGVIGIDNNLPWHLKEDMKSFKNHTINNVVIMGKKTFNSLPKALNNRVNIVVTTTGLKDSNNIKDVPENTFIKTAKSLEEAIILAKSYNKDIFIIGGKRLIEEGIKIADRVIRTLVLTTKDYDAKTVVSIDRSFEKDFKEQVISNNNSLGLEYRISYLTRS